MRWMSVVYNDTFEPVFVARFVISKRAKPRKYVISVERAQPGKYVISVERVRTGKYMNLEVYFTSLNL